ncbi:phage portal protein [Alkalihalobacillus sp. FSL W8-0930]
MTEDQGYKVNEEVEAKEEEAELYDMSFFLSGNEAKAPKEKAIITRRFKDQNGEPIPFVFQAISTERIEDLQKFHTKTITKGKRRGQKDFDNERFSAAIAVESTIYPKFSDAKILKSYGTQDAITAAKKMLSIGGEYSNWIDRAMLVNGYGEESEDVQDEEAAKN